MKHVLKVYDAELTAEGPVFIGNGKKIGKKEYAFSPWKKQISVLDPSKLSDLLSKKNLISKYGAFMLGSSREDVGKWLINNQVSEEEYMPCVRYHLDCQDAVIDTNSKLTVLEFVKDAYGLPYVPGSSIKGMLRTVLLAYDIRKHSQKYKELKENIETNIRSNRGKRRNICKRESGEIESCCFRTLERPGTRKHDAVNDQMAGIIVSDSEPLSVDDLVLCQRVELHTDGKERKLNMLREMLRPGTKIRFQVTIDASICDMTEKDINQAVSYFGKNYFECFLQKYPGMDAPSEQSVWLGGGAGFVTKTEVYPLFGTNPGVELTARIFKAVGVPDKHGHGKDKGLGVSPHICKVADYHGTRHPVGQCRLRLFTHP